jgi:hypothetical protein
MLYHTTNTGPHATDFRQALATAIITASNNGTNEVLIYVHGKTNLDGVVSEVIGERAVKALQKPGGTIASNGTTIYLETDRIRSTFRSGIIVATHLSTKSLNKVLSDRRATDIVYVPWVPQELQDYLTNNQSTAI